VSFEKSPRPVVLVVEDETLLRLNAVDIIQEAGFDTLEAPNAEEAIEILQARSDIRIVFTDVNMPGSMDGLKLASAIRKRWPPVDLIVTSGQLVPSEDELPARGHFIAKPYEARQLVDRLKSFLH
jgi:CheY-like chemotaxis protein